MAILNRWQGVLIAFLMTVLLTGRLLPLVAVGPRQIDFWLVWLLCMVLLALPVLLLESALAKRSQALPLLALPVLTREADVGPRWRINGWIAVLGALLLAGGLVAQINALMPPLLHLIFPDAAHAPSALIAALTTGLIIVAAFALSFVNQQKLAVTGALYLVVLVVLELANVRAATWQWTSFAWIEWSGAVILALASTGLGLGLYWVAALQDTPLPAKTDTPKAYGASKAKADVPRVSILPIWIAQLFGGLVVALGYSQTFPDYANSVSADASAVAQQVPMIYGYTWALYIAALICGAALLLSFVRLQLRARGFAPIIVAVISLASLALWVLPITTWLVVLTSTVLLVVSAVYAVFSGWRMKSSHLRKALNFDNEALYNLWRVQVRILVPLAVTVALVALIAQLLQQVH